MLRVALRTVSRSASSPLRPITDARGVPAAVAGWQRWHVSGRVVETEKDHQKGGKLDGAEPPAVGWVKDAPLAWQPYMRLARMDRPIGTWLLYLPSAWAISLAAPAGYLPDPTLLASFGLGALVMRGAGCTINDLWDRKIDAKVARTRNRPLASGELSTKQAVGFLAGQLGVGLGVLLSLNWYSVALGASSMALVSTYPLMKRVTYWPQLFLGLTFNWGALLGYTAVQGYADWGVMLPLYTSGVCWTLVYDTIYAHQDKLDDVLVNVKSTALLFAERTKPILGGFTLGMVASLTAAGLMASQTLPYYAGVGAAGLVLARQVASVNLDSREDCLRAFRANKWVGGLVLAGCVAGTVMKDDDPPRKPEM